MYWAKANDNTTLILSSVDGIKSVPGLNGWTVKFYDRGSDGTLNNVPAVLLCSENTCTSSSLDTGSVYIKLNRPEDRFQEYTPGELRFHNHHNANCDSDDSKEGYCDHVALVGIERNDGVKITEVKYKCGRILPGHCSVSFPKLKP